MNLNMIKCPEIMPCSESMRKEDTPKRNVRPPHEPSVKVSHMEHRDGKHSEIPVKAKLIPKDPTQRIRYHTTNETRDTPKTVRVSTAFSRRQDIRMSVKSEDMKMKISGKGDDVSFKNTLTKLWTG